MNLEILCESDAKWPTTGDMRRDDLPPRPHDGKNNLVFLTFIVLVSESEEESVTRQQLQHTWRYLRKKNTDDNLI